MSNHPESASKRMSSKIIPLLLVALALAGCSHVGNYMEFWKTERAQKKEFGMEPTAKLLRELQPGDCFLLAGPVNQKADHSGPVLVVAVTDMFKKREIVATRILQTPVLYYQAYLPEGDYDVYFFADIDRNGYFEADEMIGQTSGAPIRLRKEAVKDGMTFSGPTFMLDVNSPARTDLPINVPVRQQHYVFGSLDDPFFDPRYGEMGMYDAKKFFAHTQRFLFSLEKFNPDKTAVVFVHGVAGTPRDFRYLVAGLDKTRYQPIFYYYPSGMPLRKLGSLLADILKILGESKEFRLKRVIVAAHSMGGLVSLSALNELCIDGPPSYLRGYISFDSPYGGVESANQAVENAPAVLAAWRDVAPGSSFLSVLHAGFAAGKIPFHLFFGYKTGNSGDGTITLQSQLEHRIQFAARKTHGFNASHVGILNDEQARQQFYRVLADMDGEPSSIQKKPGLMQ
ncbi:MAG: Alpha/beta hydrolase family protein [Syntrophaceae bacterium PtaB.Bin095]|nr:MAG: Alpha/beta hydrolase family protein [Syntrophaceae bacterium PtaB.Bin095]